MEFTITWQAEDGYVGGSRPHEITINSGDFDSGDSTRVIRDQIHDAIYEDFLQTVSPGYDDDLVEEVARKIKSQLLREETGDLE